MPDPQAEIARAYHEMARQTKRLADALTALNVNVVEIGKMMQVFLPKEQAVNPNPDQGKLPLHKRD